MRFPDFFRDVPRIVLRDPLAGLLGAADEGLLEYAYEDAVKLAGHSCPTVASAFRLTGHALAALYPDDVPQRGGVRVEFRNTLDEGVTGVVASIVTLLTGAAHDGGFKGLGGRHVRRGLLRFGAELPLGLRFTRVDDGVAVDAEADLSPVPADPEVPALLAQCLAGTADDGQRQRFATLWQERVRRILLDHGDDPSVFRVRTAG